MLTPVSSIILLMLLAFFSRVAAPVSTHRLPWIWTGILAMGVTAGALGTFVLTRLQPPAPTSSEPALYEVRHDALERAISLNAVAEWEPLAAIAAPSGGLVTEVFFTHGFIDAGDVILLRNERPTIAIAGDIPVFRAMEAGNSGRDVAALEAYLVDEGFLESGDDTYTAETAEAVRRWQTDMSLPPSGVVDLGDVVIIPPDELTSPFRLADGITTGSRLSADQSLLERLTDAPSISIDVGPSAPDNVEPGLVAEVLLPSGEQLIGRVGRFSTQDGIVTIHIEGPEGGPVCQLTECSPQLPLDVETRVAVNVVVLPRTVGPVVPVAAIQTDPDGEPFVRLSDGRPQSIEIRAAVGGMVIVSGLEPGTHITLP